MPDISSSYSPLVCKDRHASKERERKRSFTSVCCANFLPLSNIRPSRRVQWRQGDWNQSLLADHRRQVLRTEMLACIVSLFRTLIRSFFSSCYCRSWQCLDGNQQRPCVASDVVMMLCCYFTLEMCANAHIAPAKERKTSIHNNKQYSIRGYGQGTSRGAIARYQG